MHSVLMQLSELLRRGEEVAMATVLDVRGSTPQYVGARLLRMQNGETFGTIGGGAIEQRIIEELEILFSSRQSRKISFDLTHDLGMCCGGSMEFLLEYLGEKERLFLIGAGHIAKPTAEFASRCGFDVYVIDEREELNTAERFPDCTRLLISPEECIERFTPNACDYVVIVTHDHQLDERCLGLFGAQPHRYIGMIGSKRKVIKVQKRLAVSGDIPPRERIFAPVGLDLGAKLPAEIGISIVSQMLAVRHGKEIDNMSIIDQNEFEASQN